MSTAKCVPGVLSIADDAVQGVTGGTGVTVVTGEIQNIGKRCRKNRKIKNWSVGVKTERLSMLKIFAYFGNAIFVLILHPEAPGAHAGQR